MYTPYSCHADGSHDSYSEDISSSKLERPSPPSDGDHMHPISDGDIAGGGVQVASRRTPDSPSRRRCPSFSVASVSSRPLTAADF